MVTNNKLPAATGNGRLTTLWILSDLDGTEDSSQSLMTELRKANQCLT
jgi:hypothetical protein